MAHCFSLIDVKYFIKVYFSKDLYYFIKFYLTGYLKSRHTGQRSVHQSQDAFRAAYAAPNGPPRPWNGVSACKLNLFSHTARQTKFLLMPTVEKGDEMFEF